MRGRLSSGNFNACEHLPYKFELLNLFIFTYAFKSLWSELRKCKWNIILSLNGFAIHEKSRLRNSASTNSFFVFWLKLCDFNAQSFSSLEKEICAAINLKVNEDCLKNRNTCKLKKKKFFCQAIYLPHNIELIWCCQSWLKTRVRLLEEAKILPEAIAMRHDT